MRIYNIMWILRRCYTYVKIKEEREKSRNTKIVRTVGIVGTWYTEKVNTEIKFYVYGDSRVCLVHAYLWFFSCIIIISFL